MRLVRVYVCVGGSLIKSFNNYFSPVRPQLETFPIITKSERVPFMPNAFDVLLIKDIRINLNEATLWWWVVTGNW